MFNKIAITGHSNGIGKAITNVLSTKYDVVGFDKSNNYDIDTDVHRIIKDSMDCDVFINNAYSDNQQCILADAWFTAHSTQEHLLINISSVSGSPEFEGDKWIEKYSANKKALTKKGWDINHSGKKCNCITIMPGITNTKLVDPLEFPEGSKIREFYKMLVNKNTILDPMDVANTVNWALEQYNDRYFVSSVTVMNRMKWDT